VHFSGELFEEGKGGTDYDTTQTMSNEAKLPQGLAWTVITNKPANLLSKTMSHVTDIPL
jgi:hypothetical protein